MSGRSRAAAGSPSVGPGRVSPGHGGTALAAAFIAILAGCGPVLSRTALSEAKTAVAEARADRRADVYALTRAEVYLSEARERLAHADHEDSVRYAEAATRWARRATAEADGAAAAGALR